MPGIGTHLQRQRPHAKGRHSRGRQRLDKHGYPDDGVPWGQKGWDPIVGSPAPTVPSTGATAGIPGIWTPAGSLPPATLTALMTGVPNVVVASPTSGWTGGQFVQTRTAGGAGRACWTGAAWVGGIAPGLRDATIDDVKAYVNGLPGDNERSSIIQEVLDAERQGQNRTTLVSWLDQQTGVE
jgi:hypothetical protein